MGAQQSLAFYLFIFYAHQAISIDIQLRPDIVDLESDGVGKMEKAEAQLRLITFGGKVLSKTNRL